VERDCTQISFCTGVGKSSIFGFIARMRDYLLLLGIPRD
jgi:hypothetical protein